MMPETQFPDRSFRPWLPVFKDLFYSFRWIEVDPASMDSISALTEVSEEKFEQKVAKEAKVWAGNCDGPEFILESRFQERGGAGWLRGPEPCEVTLGEGPTESCCRKPNS